LKLLIDGDIIAYRAAAAAETPINWGDGLWTLHAHEDDVMRKVDEGMQRLIDGASATMELEKVAVAISHTNNFRKEIADYYKANRKDTRKPMLLKFAKDYMYDEYDGIMHDNLEADDVLGLYATGKEEWGIWSLDKDLLSIPGYHYFDEAGMWTEIDDETADRWFYKQALTGDMVDNYPGCPRVGDKTADKILDGSGKPWDLVVAAYYKAGLSEEVALEQARLARILRNGEYDYTTGEVTLWNPPS
jgi:DNA polymerase-1